MASSATEPTILITTGLIVVSVIFPLLSLVAIGLRVKARSIARQPLKADDWLAFLSWVFAFGLSILSWIFADKTGVNHFKVSPEVGIEYSLMCLLIMVAFVQFPLTTVKLSILLFYKRIFNIKPFKIAIWLTIPLVFCWGVIFFILVLVQSDPIQGSWTNEGVLRFDSISLGLAQTGSSIALDVLILCFPVPVIFGLHLSTKRKIAIATIFWLGIFCCVAAAVRLYEIHEFTQLVIASRGQGSDVIYTQNINIIFAIIEPNCSIIACCLPCYGTLFRSGRTAESLVRSVRSVFSLRSANSSNSRSNHGRGREVRVTDQAPNSSIGSSQVELKQASTDWKVPPNGSGPAKNVDKQWSAENKNRINVTQEIDVTSS